MQHIHYRRNMKHTYRIYHSMYKAYTCSKYKYRKPMSAREAVPAMGMIELLLLPTPVNNDSNNDNKNCNSSNNNCRNRSNNIH